MSTKKKLKKTNIFKSIWQKVNTNFQKGYLAYGELNFVKTYRQNGSGKVLCFCMVLFGIFVIDQQIINLRSESDFRTQQVICGDLIYASTRKKGYRSSLEDETFVKISAAGKENKFRIGEYDGNVKGTGIGINTRELVKEWSDLYKGSQVCVEFIKTPTFQTFPLSVCLLENPLECLAEKETRKIEYLDRRDYGGWFIAYLTIFLTSLIILLYRMKKMQKNQLPTNSHNKETL